MSYLKVKKKNNELSTGVKSSSPHIVKSSSPQKNKVYKKNTRVICAHARGNRKSQFGAFSSTPNTAVGDHTTISQFFSGAVQERGKSTNTGGRSCSVFNAFQKRHGKIENHGKIKKLPFVYPVFQNKHFEIIYLDPPPNICCLGSLKEWEKVRRD